MMTRIRSTVAAAAAVSGLLLAALGAIPATAAERAPMPALSDAEQEAVWRAAEAEAALEEGAPPVIQGCRLAPKATCPGVDLRHRVLKRLDLNGVDLTGADLARVDLRQADLRGAKLVGANLIGADLRHSFLQGADLTGARLMGANLEYARLNGAKLDRADLTAANLEMARANKASLRDAVLVDANLQETKLYAAILSGADMSGAWKRFAIFQDAIIDGCKDCPVDW